MRLRRAVSIIFLATMVVLTGALYAVARSTLLVGFGEVERRETIRNVERARAALDELLEAMSSKASDWAAWDDTCVFVADRNQAYIESNLTPASLANLDIDAILIFDNGGGLVTLASIDAASGIACDPPADLVETLRSAGLTFHPNETSETTGVLVLDDGPALVASRPIITSDNKGPVRGSVVFVRRLCTEVIDGLSERTHLDISFFRPGAPNLPADGAAALPSLAESSITIAPQSPDRIAGYHLIADASDEPALLLRVQTDREVYQQGLVSMRWLLASIVVVGLAIGASTLVLINRLVISRLERMSALVERIGKGDNTVVLPEGGVSELAVLSSSINRMVAAITTASDQLASRAAELNAKSEQLDLSRRAAEAANRAKTEFLANMSHEIRTPMTAVLGYTDLLMEPGLSEGERLQHLRMIHAAGHSLLSIINDILDISKIEAGHLSVESVPMSPIGVVTDVVSLLRAKADAKGLRLVVRCDTPIPETVSSDPARLRQILLNIVGNAVKFTPEGEVVVALSATRPDGDRPAVLSFRIIDTGPGIPPEQLERLFKPFSQADSSTARRFGGTGLGLCISMRLAEALGGTITVSSDVSTGATFTITIHPAAVQDGAWTDQLIPSPTPIPRSGAGVARSLSGRILLADDMAENQRLISLILRKAGAEVEVVSDGSEALNAALAARDSANPFDLIVLDMQMPVMDGYTAAARLRAAGLESPIVALTAFALSGEREKCLAAGCDDYATKPVDRAGFIRMCALWIERAAAGRQGSPAA